MSLCKFNLGGQFAFICSAEVDLRIHPTFNNSKSSLKTRWFLTLFLIHFRTDMLIAAGHCMHSIKHYYYYSPSQAEAAKRTKLSSRLGLFYKPQLSSASKHLKASSAHLQRPQIEGPKVYHAIYRCDSGCHYRALNERATSDCVSKTKCTYGHTDDLGDLQVICSTCDCPPPEGIEAQV